MSGIICKWYCGSIFFRQKDSKSKDLLLVKILHDIGEKGRQ